MAKANLGADAAKAVFLRSPPVGRSVQVSHNGSYVKEKLFSVVKHGTACRFAVRRGAQPRMGN